MYMNYLQKWLNCIQMLKFWLKYVNLAFFSKIMLTFATDLETTYNTYNYDTQEIKNENGNKRPM